MHGPHIWSSAVGDEQVSRDACIQRLRPRAGCSFVIANPLALLELGQGEGEGGVLTLPLGLAASYGEGGLPTGIVDQCERPVAGLLRWTLKGLQCVWAAATGQVLARKLGRGGPTARQLASQQAGRVVCRCLRLLLLLVQLALEAHTTCVAKSLVAVCIIPPHGRLCGTALRASLRDGNPQDRVLQVYDTAVMHFRSCRSDK